MSRLGMITPSRFADVMTYPKGYKSVDELAQLANKLEAEQEMRVKSGRTDNKVFQSTAEEIEAIDYKIDNWKDVYEFGDTALTYAKECALGRLGVQMPEIKAKALDHGVEWEPEARRIYNELSGLEAFKPEVRQAYGNHITGECDGLVGDDGLIEIKCPFNPVNHLNNLLTWEQTEQYKWQIQGYMMIYNRQWCDFISFNPNFPDWNTQIGWTRINRDDAMIQQIQERTQKLNTIIEEIHEQIISRVFRPY